MNLVCSLISEQAAQRGGGVTIPRGVSRKGEMWH